MTEIPATGTEVPALRLTAELVHQHQAALWRYLRVLGCASAEAEDLVQETFLVLLRTRVADHGPAATRGWLRSTARYQFFAQCRSSRRAPLADLEAIEAAWQHYESDDDGERYRAALRECLETLPARQRDLLDLQLRDRATPAELGAATGLAPEGARSLLRRIKLALRDCVTRRTHGSR